MSEKKIRVSVSAEYLVKHENRNVEMTRAEYIEYLNMCAAPRGKDRQRYFEGLAGKCDSSEWEYDRELIGFDTLMVLRQDADGLDLEHDGSVYEFLEECPE